MLITLKPLGLFEQYLDRLGVQVQLPEGSTLAGLYTALDGLWQREPPPEIWDATKLRFTVDHLVIANGKTLQGEQDSLPPGALILLIPPIEGG